MSTKPFPAPGQVWTFAGSGFAPSSGPHTVKTLRWFHGTAEAVFDDDSTASIGWMMELDAWQLVDARPDNLAELARLTAAELRKRGIWADVDTQYAPNSVRAPTRGMLLMHSQTYHSLSGSCFDKCGPIACADVIQAESATRAQEWAGDT